MAYKRESQPADFPFEQKDENRDFRPFGTVGLRT